jgi:prolyl oligopeptidase
MKLKKTSVDYPYSRKDQTVADTYFGVEIADPYRWLEDDNGAETRDWVARQNEVTEDFLRRIPFRQEIKGRLEEVWNFEKFGTPFKKAGVYYFFKNDGLQNQAVLYVQQRLTDEPAVALDPNTFSADGTASLQEYDISRSGRYLAFGISTGGSDWRTIRIKDMERGEMLDDAVHWAKFTGIAWAGDGFYYSRYPAPAEGQALTAANQNSAVYYHHLGQPQDADELVYHDPAHPNYYFGGGTTEDERFLIVTASESTSGNMLFFKDLEKKDAPFLPVSTSFESDFAVVDNLDGKLLVLTNQQAPNQRLVLIDTERPEPGHWSDLIPENADDVLLAAAVCGDKLLCAYLHHAASRLRVFSLEGRLLKELELPEIGTVGNVSGKKGEPLAFFSFQSFLRPNTIFSLDTETLETAVFKAPRLNFDPGDFITEQVWFRSKDGTRVPMFITRRRDLPMDGRNPAILYGYGGFNIPVTPGFAASKAVLLEKNGIYAVANIRGGGEFGEKWHKAGTKCLKQNVFDDFIAAAGYLIEQKYTASDRLAIEGGSNGGLLVGACMTQRPDLFAVCFPRVGVLDMLRYHLFTIGYAWATDYGRSDDPEEFPCLRAYSPLHNLRYTRYPATMIVTADHDDRVVPAHSFKFAAALQEHQQGDQPALIRIDVSAGHGAGKPTDKAIREAADMLAFFFFRVEG